MKLRIWLLAIAASLVVAICVIAISVSSSQKPSPAEPDEPLATATVPHAATSSPNPTATATGQPVPGDDGGEDTAGCASYGPGTACDDLEPPETISGAQTAATTIANDFVANYVRFDSRTGEEAWRARLAGITAPSMELPMTHLAREDSALAGLQVRSTLDESRPVQAYVDGVDSDGGWLFTVNATVVAKYTDATGTTSNWSVPGTWTVTVDPASKKVSGVDESTPALDDAP